MSTTKIREALERLQRDNIENRDVTSLVTDAIGEVVAIEKAAQDLMAFAAIEYATRHKAEQKMVNEAESLLERIAKETT